MVGLFYGTVMTVKVTAVGCLGNEVAADVTAVGYRGDECGQ